MVRIAVVTSEPGRPRDDDLDPLVDALGARGVDVSVVDWDDGDADWSVFDLAVIRSTWDYSFRHDEFLDWTRRCGAVTRLANPAEVVAWNSDKRYLDQLRAAGVAVVPTTFVADAGSFDPSRDLPSDEEFVVKPTVSAGSANTVRYHRGDVDAAAVQIRDLLAIGKVPMVQPYQRAVDDEGETALLFFGGRLSHAVNKGPLLVAGREAHRALFAEEHITAASATAEQRELAERCLAALSGVPQLAGVEMPLAYARVDVLTDNDGNCSVLELELTEPSVFFAWSDGGADRFAEVLVERAEVQRVMGEGTR